MEFIKAEQFQEQPKEVQEVLIEWWKSNMSECDLIYNLKFNDKRCLTDSEMFNSKFKQELLLKSTNIPLLTEGQLRKFIEDKTKCILTIEYDDEDNTYAFHLVSTIYNKEDYGWSHDLGTDLLQAYWKVAIEVANRRG